MHEIADVKIRNDMPFDLAALLGCGGVGWSTIYAAKMAGAARIFAIDIDRAKLKMAELLGATDLLDSQDSDLVTKVIETTQCGVHHAFECIGLKSTKEASFAMLRARGCPALLACFPWVQKSNCMGSILYVNSVFRRV